MASRKKPIHKAIEIKTIKGRKGTYIWMRTPKGQYHAFREVTLFEAAKDCGASQGSVPAVCKEVWDRS